MPTVGQEGLVPPLLHALQTEGPTHAELSAKGEPACPKIGGCTFYICLEWMGAAQGFSNALYQKEGRKKMNKYSTYSWTYIYSQLLS